MKKLDDKRYGPFPIMAKVGASAYRLKLPKTWKHIYDVFNEAVLTPYHAPAFRQQAKPPPPPPIIIDDVPEYEVEQIIDSHVRRGRTEYLVKWKDYPREENTWEPRSMFTHSEETIEEFHRTHPTAPRLDARALFDWTV